MQTDIFKRSSELCVSCGLCCTGGLTDGAALLPDEAEFAQALLGLKISSNGKYLSLPCQLHQNGKCTIYTTRFNVCRVYKCELLRNYERGEVSFELASIRVKEGKYRYEKLRRNFGLETSQSFWRANENFQKKCSESLDFRRQNAELLLEIISYKQFLKNTNRIDRS